jgi:poly(beta-D-mannuronate) lyase
MLLVTANPIMATDFNVSNANDISNAMNSAQPGDVLIMADGVWTNQDIDFAGDGNASNPITLRPETEGGVTLNGDSQLSISGSYLVVDGLNFEGGGTNSMSYLVEFRGSDGDADHCRMTNTTILNYNAPDRSHQYHWVEIFGQDNRVDHCRFEGQDHEGVTLVVRLDDNGQAARHQIDHNAFLNRPVGQDSNGHEMMRIGTSARNGISAQCVVENNLFENCDGEIEIISNKSADNVYRYNTFRSCAGTLTLRHGKAATVAGNFFLGEGKNRSGGIRVVDSDHIIVNNYFDDIDDRADAAISLVAGIDGGPANGYQPVDNVDIHNNTIVDVGGAAVIFDWGFGDTDNGGVQDQLPSNISFVNNLIRSSRTLFEGQEGSGYTWTDNIAFGASLGISSRTGLQQVNPQISVAADGLWRPDSGSPAIDGGTTLPAITIDMDGQSRVGAYDIGADEDSTDTITLFPLTTADVGPYSEATDPVDPVDPPASGTIVDDSFSDGDRAITGNSGTDLEAAFFHTSNTNGIEDAVGSVGLVSGSSGRQIHAIFPTQTLATAGDSITSTVTFTTPATIGDSDDLRFGLFNGGAALAQDLTNNSSNPEPLLIGQTGYVVELDVDDASTSTSQDINFRRANPSTSGRLLGTTGDISSLSNGPSLGYVFAPNTQYSIEHQITRNEAGELENFAEFIDITNGATIGSFSTTDSNPLSFDFGLLGVSATSDAFGSASTPDTPDNGIDISNVTITFDTAATPAPLKGDVDLSSVVDFADIPAFITVLQSGVFQAEADCDCSGVVDFSDIPAFILILQAG